MSPASSTTTRQDLLWALCVCTLVALLLFVRISAFGIWDPWELGAADTARHLAAGEAISAPASFSTWLVSIGFRMFGVHEWAGRAPIALAGVLTAALAFVIGKSYAGARTGFYAALIAGTTPLFLFNSRAMLGEAPAFFVQTGIALCALRAIFPSLGLIDSADSADSMHSARIKPAARVAWLVALLGLVVLSIMTRGALLGALPPLAAVSIVGWFERDDVLQADRTAQRLVYGLSALSVALSWLVLRAVIGDSAELNMWIGGRAVSAAPPTFDAVIEEVFHSFAPWSALLPLALGRMWQLTAHVHELDADADVQLDTSTTPERTEAPLRLVALLWAALGFGAQTLYFSRYGREVCFLPVVALAVLVALLLRDIEQRGGSHWALAISAMFLAGLVLRDYALYPSGPLGGMPIDNFEVPKVWNPRGQWAAVLGAFAAFALFGFGADPSAPADLAELKRALRAPYAWVRDQWRRGLPFKLWLMATVLVLLGIAVFGALAYAIPDKLHLSTLAAKWVRRLLFVPLFVPIGIAGMQVALLGFARLRSYRFVPLLVSGLAVGVYAAQGFLPALSEHFSPREIYETYNALAHNGEALGEYRVGGRAATYYAKGPVVELKSVPELVEHLAGSAKPSAANAATSSSANTTRRWVAFPADELPNIDRAYRKRSGEHIVIADSRSARVVLGTNLPLSGKKNESEISRFVRKTIPDAIEHTVSVNFDDRIQLLGYDLKLPHDGYVGAGESFKLIWYFRATGSVPGDYRLFVHIDGDGQRIHGDHDPVDGKYPIRMWDEGDVIVDEQELDVPSTFRKADYVIYMGIYSGETRLPVRSGPIEADNRVRIGVLRIQ